MAGAVAAKLSSIKDKAGIGGRQVAALMGTTPQTVSRWQQGHSDPRQPTLRRLLTLEWLASQLAEFYGPTDARVWLYSPHRLLAGATPADLIAGGRMDDVLAVIDQLRTSAVV